MCVSCHALMGRDSRHTSNRAAAPQNVLPHCDMSPVHAAQFFTGGALMHGAPPVARRSCAGQTGIARSRAFYPPNAAGRSESRMLPLPYNASRRGMRRGMRRRTYVQPRTAQAKRAPPARREAGPGAGDPPGLARASAANRWARAACRCLSRGLGRIFGGKGGILGRHLRAPFCAHTRPHRG
jgi:hypothetical protein